MSVFQALKRTTSSSKPTTLRVAALLILFSTYTLKIDEKQRKNISVTVYEGERRKTQYSKTNSGLGF